MRVGAGRPALRHTATSVALSSVVPTGIAVGDAGGVALDGTMLVAVGAAHARAQPPTSASQTGAGTPASMSRPTQTFGLADADPPARRGRAWLALNLELVLAGAHRDRIRRSVGS